MQIFASHLLYKVAWLGGRVWIPGEEEYEVLDLRANLHACV